MKERKKLSDIITPDTASAFKDAWKTTAAAADTAPVPRGKYVARLVSGELETSKHKQTPGYKMKFEIIEGPYSGRQIWHDCWLTAAALPMTKRDLAKIGITTSEQMEQPVPRGIVVALVVVVHNDDDGVPYNKVKSFEFLRTEEPPPNPFPAVLDPDSGPGGDKTGATAAVPEPVTEEIPV